MGMEAMCHPGSVTSKPGWYEYHGLWEYQQRGSGPTPTPSQPHRVGTACPMHCTHASSS